MSTVLEEIHLNDIGTVFRATLYDGSTIVDVSGATTLELVFGKPDGTSSAKTATFTDDGVDGQIQYTVVDGDLDQLGDWKIQAHIILLGGEWRSNIDNFRVYKNI